MGDGLVHLVAADPNRAADDDPPQGDHRHLAGAPTDVHHHPPDRLLNRHPGPDRRGDRLLDQVHAASPGGQGRLLHRSLLDLGHAGGRAHDQPRVGRAAIDHLANEVPQHLLGDLEVGDHPVAQWPGGRDRRRRPADHPLGFGPDRVDLAGGDIRGDHRGLGDHDPAAADVHQRVGRAEIDGHVMDPEGGRKMAPGVVATRTVSTKPDADKTVRCERCAPASLRSAELGALRRAGWSQVSVSPLRPRLSMSGAGEAPAPGGECVGGGVQRA
jgi:hypothetical protein